MTSTHEQLLAQSADRHLAVTAGAGAGKTTALVRRFLNLILPAERGKKKVDVRSITAITFTRKAASEMLHRLAIIVDEMLKNPEYKPRWEEIKRVRERLSSANISTIHSFCARLLREFPIEAGVNPNFTEMQEYESRLLKERAIVRTLEQWLDEEMQKEEQKEKQEEEQKENKSETNMARARQLWNAFGKKDLQELLSQILSNSEMLVEIRDLYARTSDADFLMKRDSTFIPDIAAKARRYLQTLDEMLTNVIDTSLLNPTNATTQKLAQASGAAGIALRVCDEVEQTDPMAYLTQRERVWQNVEQLFGGLEAAREFAGNKDGSTSKKGIGKGIADLELFNRINTDLQEQYKALAGIESVIKHRHHDTELLELARTLVDIAADAFEDVQQEKERRGVLDFDDLQMKTEHLLDNETVRDRLRRTIPFLMIDEFQDTNELQYSIAKKVISSWGTETLQVPETPHSETLLSPASNLFIVGDPKQSIYRFRGADVRVFARAKADIERTNRALFAKRLLKERFDTPAGLQAARSDAEKFGRVSLAATFRLAPVVAWFVNRVCGFQMRRAESEFDVEYEDIICGIGTASNVRGSATMLLARKPPKAAPQVSNDGHFSNIKTEFFGEPVGNYDAGSSSTDNPNEPSEVDTERIEAELLASHIRTIIEVDRLHVRDGNSSTETRPATYRDVYVLARSRAGFDALAGAFRRARVPFFVSGGRGYYERQEILDMRAMVLFLQNTGDDISCAAVLRSPMFTISDDELYSISRCGGASFWERAISYYEQYKDSRASAAFLRAHDTLTLLLPLAARLTIPSLLRVIIEQTGWRGVIAADERFEQIEANIEKLLGAARDFENQGFRNLYDFAEELRILAEYSLNEGEADVTTDQNAVTMMTIHASKGLEAPIVALYKTNSESGRTPMLYTDTALGLAFKLPRRVDGGNYEPTETPLYALAHRRHELAEKAELKRLLYVALTRAKDHLIISGAIAEKNDGTLGAVQSFLRMILEGLGWSGENMLHAIQLATAPPHVLKVLRENAVVEITLDDNDVKIPILHVPREQIQSQIQIQAELQPPTQGAAAITTNVSGATIIHKPLLLQPLVANVEGDFYSASQLRLFAQDPDEYERVYRLGLLPSDDDEQHDHANRTQQAARLEYSRFEADDDDERTVGTAGASAGTAIHAVLQYLPRFFDATGALDEQQLDALVSRVVPESANAAPALRERVWNEVRKVAQTPLLKRFAKHLSGVGNEATARYEYSLSLPFDHVITDATRQISSGLQSRDVLIGTLDALVRNERGDWEIWDWKTNRVSSQNGMNALAEDYRLQLELYAYFLSYLAPDQHRFTTRLLFTRRAAPTALDQDWTRSVEFSRERMDSIRQRISERIADIRAVSYGV